MDELAAAAGADPIEFRLKVSRSDRQARIEVLDRVAALAKWDKRPSPKGSQSDDVGDRPRRQPTANTSWCAPILPQSPRSRLSARPAKSAARASTSSHDCGQIINPDGLKNQIEGNVIQTVSRTLKEELKFSRSAVTSVDWASYPILTFPEMPEIVMDLIDRPNTPPWGAGEPSAAVVPSAISNAVFDAIGVRLRSVPFTPDKVKAAPRAA